MKNLKLDRASSGIVLGIWKEILLARSLASKRAARLDCQLVQKCLDSLMEGLLARLWDYL